MADLVAAVVVAAVDALTGVASLEATGVATGVLLQAPNKIEAVNAAEKAKRLRMFIQILQVVMTNSLQSGAQQSCHADHGAPERMHVAGILPSVLGKAANIPSTIIKRCGFGNTNPYNLSFA
ncbi:MAG: hypothetical protein Q8R67_07320 [Rhodoferax sp.]|nr:hypothetical protein [Rhodoferax sp.]MDP3651475.1 hypothetical protein [Rhodoferax sp.]